MRQNGLEEWEKQMLLGTREALTGPVKMVLIRQANVQIPPSWLVSEEILGEYLWQWLPAPIPR